MKLYCTCIHLYTHKLRVFEGSTLLSAKRAVTLTCSIHQQLLVASYDLAILSGDKALGKFYYTAEMEQESIYLVPRKLCPNINFCTCMC